MARVLVACEFSGVVRDAFRMQGHAAHSYDLLTGDSPYHIRGDLRKENLEWYKTWDMMIAFPPCTYLASSGARWWRDKAEEQAEAIRFVRMLMSMPVRRIAIENPIGKISSAIRKPDQIIQPWQFGHGETKATCLWLKGLPCLVPTNIVEGREPRVHREPPSPDRWKKRSITYSGIAAAMVTQWGPLA